MANEWEADRSSEEPIGAAQTSASPLSPDQALAYDLAIGSPKPQAKPAKQVSWEDAHAEAPVDENDKTSVYAGTVLRGIPVVGAYIPKAEAYAQALAHPYTGVGETGDTVAERYSKNLEKANARYQNFDMENPGASTALKIGGGVLSTIPVGMTRAGAWALGLGGKSLPQMIGRSSASGALVSAADAAARGNDPMEAATTGGEIGALGPIVGTIGGRVLRGIRGLQPVPTEPHPSNFITIGGSKIPMSGPEMTGSRPGEEWLEEAIQGAHGERAQKVARDFVLNEQKPAIEEAGTGIMKGMDPNGTIHAMTADDAGQVIGDAIRQKASASKANYDQLYDNFRQSPGQFAPFQNLGDGIKATLPPEWGAVLQAPEIVPASSNMIAQLNKFSGRPLTTNDIDVLGKVLRRFSDAAKNETDAALSSRIVHGYNDAIDQAMASGHYQGDPNAINSWRAAKAAYAQHQNLFAETDQHGRLTASGQMIKGILNEDQPMSHLEVANRMYGGASGAPKDTGPALNVIDKMKEIFGENSPEFSAVEQGAFGRMTAGMTPDKAQKNLSQYLTGTGKEMAKAIHGHDTTTLPALEQYRDVMDKITPEVGVVNSSNSGNMLARVVAEPIKKHMVGAITAGLGHMAGGVPGALVAGALGEIFDRAVGGVPQRLAARETRRVLYGRPGQTSVRQVARQTGAAAGVGAAPTLSQKERQEKTAALARRQAKDRALAQSR